MLLSRSVRNSRRACRYQPGAKRHPGKSKGNLFGIEQLTNRFLVVSWRVNGKEDYTAFLIFAFEFFNNGQSMKARSAPNAPEVEKNHLAPIVRKLARFRRTKTQYSIRGQALTTGGVGRRGKPRLDGLAGLFRRRSFRRNRKRSQANYHGLKDWDRS